MAENFKDFAKKVAQEAGEKLMESHSIFQETLGSKIRTDLNCIHN